MLNLMRMLVLFNFTWISSLYSLSPVTIQTLYGDETIEEPVILELLISPAMQRLQNIDQSGFVRYTNRIGSYTRYIHSVGVYQLLKRFNAPLTEQIAGLLHDTSHTVFSHTGDWLYFQGSHDHAYQDNIHSWYLSKQGIEPIVNKYGISLKQAMAKNPAYKLLDQELPDVCADRLEYNLFTGHLYGFFSQDDINAILNDIHFEDGKWFFEDPSIAVKYASVSLYFTEHLWGSAWNVMTNELSARALKRALEIGVVTFDDVHFGTDQEVLDKLHASNDAIIYKYLRMCDNVENHYILCSPEEADYQCKAKFRGIDPLVSINGTFVRLTSLDANFKAHYDRVKTFISTGLYFKILD